MTTEAAERVYFAPPEVTTVKAERDSLLDQTAAYRAALAAKNETIMVMRAEGSRLQEENARLLKRIQQLTGEVDSLSLQLEEADETHLMAAMATSADLRERIQQMDAACTCGACQ